MKCARLCEPHITGAGSGLGAAVARMVVKQQGKAMLLDVNEEAIAALARELGSRP